MENLQIVKSKVQTLIVLKNNKSRTMIITIVTMTMLKTPTMITVIEFMMKNTWLQDVKAAAYWKKRKKTYRIRHSLSFNIILYGSNIHCYKDVNHTRIPVFRKLNQWWKTRKTWLTAQENSGSKQKQQRADS